MAAQNINRAGVEVYFAVYGSLVNQERGKIHQIPLPVKGGSDDSYSKAWYTTDITISTDFNRLSSAVGSTRQQGDINRMTKSRFTLVPTLDGIETKLYVAESRAHELADFNINPNTGVAYTFNRLIAATRALKCREDMVNSEECKTGNVKGDQYITYVIAENLVNPTTRGDQVILRFSIVNKEFTARYNPLTTSEEAIWNMGKWLLDNKSKAILMAALPSNVNEGERNNILRTEIYNGKSVGGVRGRSKDYYNNLPLETKMAHRRYGDRL